MAREQPSYRITSEGLESATPEETSILSGDRFKEILEKYTLIRVKIKQIGEGKILVELPKRSDAEEAAHLLRDFKDGKIDLG